MTDLADLVCPLCGGESIADYYSDQRRDYFQCSQCRLVFVPPCQHLSPEQEKAHYDLHQNNPDDQGYRQFLSRLAEPLMAQLTPGMSGLDFGSGPGPTLSLMLQEAGFSMAIYDHYYANDALVLKRDYDFVTASEVVEHLSAPGKVLQQLWSIIKPGGCFGIMTKRLLDKTAFTRWHYKNDPTHICFFSDETFEFIAQELGAVVQFPGKDVVLLQKQ